MIYITGDLHGEMDIKRLNSKRFPFQKDMTKDDYLIVCGDFGLVWNGSPEEKYWRKWLNEKPFTTLFVDGNHENHHMLNDYPIEEWCGGKIHKINDSIFHLMRGEIFTLQGKKFFCMGGASSHDKELRKENVSWWAEEMPSNEEYDNAISNLEKHDYQVDYVVSHCCADSIQDEINRAFSHDKLTNFLEYVVKADCEYTRHYFGHYHLDFDFDERHRCLYYGITRIK